MTAKILNSRRPCCGRVTRLDPTPGTHRVRCRQCKTTWIVDLVPAHEHTRSIVGHDDLFRAHWSRPPAALCRRVSTS